MAKLFWLRVPFREAYMSQQSRFDTVLVGLLSLLAMVAFLATSGTLLAADAPAGGKVKVLYHVDGKDPEVAKYALALINKHIEAEGGPDKIDVELVVHGPALELFEKDKMDAEMTKRFEQILEKGVKAEMCQVSMKL